MEGHRGPLALARHERRGNSENCMREIVGVLALAAIAAFTGVANSAQDPRCHSSSVALHADYALRATDGIFPDKGIVNRDGMSRLAPDPQDATAAICTFITFDGPNSETLLPPVSTGRA